MPAHQKPWTLPQLPIVFVPRLTLFFFVPSLAQTQTYFSQGIQKPENPNFHYENSEFSNSLHSHLEQTRISVAVQVPSRSWATGGTNGTVTVPAVEVSPSAVTNSGWTLTNAARRVSGAEAGQCWCYPTEYLQHGSGECVPSLRCWFHIWHSCTSSDSTRAVPEDIYKFFLGEVVGEAASCSAGEVLRGFLLLFFLGYLYTNMGTWNLICILYPSSTSLAALSLSLFRFNGGTGITWWGWTWKLSLCVVWMRKTSSTQWRDK